MIATIDDVAAALRVRDIHVEVIDAGEPDHPVLGINVRMADPHARYADDTIWPPARLDRPPTPLDRAWIWGDRFQHQLPADATPDQIADAVADTVRARP